MDSLDFLIFIPHFHPLWGSCPLSPGSGLGLEDRVRREAHILSSHCSQALVSPNPQEHGGLCYSCSLCSLSLKVVPELEGDLAPRRVLSPGPEQCCPLTITLPRTLGLVNNAGISRLLHPTSGWPNGTLWRFCTWTCWGWLTWPWVFCPWCIRWGAMWLMSLASWWESSFLGRLIRSPGLSGRKRGQTFFSTMSCLPHMKLIFFKPRANDYIVPPEHTQDWGYRLLESTNKTLCTPRPRREVSDPTRNWPRLVCECPRVSSRGVGQW